MIVMQFFLLNSFSVQDDESSVQDHALIYNILVDVTSHFVSLLARGETDEISSHYATIWRPMRQAGSF